MHALLPSILISSNKPLMTSSMDYSSCDGHEPCASLFQMEVCLTLKVSTRSHMFLRICLMNAVTSCVVLKCHKISTRWKMNWIASQGLHVCINKLAISSLE